MITNVMLLGSELGKGGAERSISLLSYYLEQQPQYRVTLVVLSGRDREKFYKTCSHVEFVDPPAATSIWGKVQAWRYRLRRVRELKQSLKIDVCISFLEGPDYVNVLTKGREKVVLSIRGTKTHDTQIMGLQGFVRKRLLMSSLYRRADQIVCVCNALGDEMRSFGVPDRKLTTIYNFYEVEHIRQVCQEPLPAAEAALMAEPVIIAAGRLDIAKAFDLLIRAFARVRAQAPTARLVLLGDGPFRERLTRLAQELGLTVADWQAGPQPPDAALHFLGFQSNAFRFYSRARVFALSSISEGFPNVLAESLICRRPVVSTDCHTGPREILNLADALPPTDLTAPVRTAVGTLTPLLAPPTDAALDYFAAELVHWLHAPAPSAVAFDDLIARFTLDAMLSAWGRVIEQR